MKVQALSDKLRTKVTKGKDTVTDAQVSAYYNKNKSRFAQPERRDLLIVLTKTKAQADAAAAALKRGQSWKAVAKKYSIDQASKNQGGKLLAVAKGQQEKALDDAVFKASKSKVYGPIKTQFGYYVFKVTKITKASQQTLTQATPTIKQLLQSQNQQKALDSFVKDFQKRWKDKTNCRHGYVTQDCKNAPKPKSTSTVPPGGVTTQKRAAREPGHHDQRRVSQPDEVAQAVGRLDELTRRLREECPWDREQDERSIVPHTVEESYELADAAQRGDDRKLLDELGDVLFQVHFLALLLEERGAGSMADVAEHCRQKLIRRHPHVFGDVEVAHAGEVLRNWDAIKQGEEGREPGIFGEVPENLPGPLYARKVQRRAATSGFDFDDVPYEADLRASWRSSRRHRRARTASTRPATSCSRRSTSRAS